MKTNLIDTKKIIKYLLLSTLICNYNSLNLLYSQNSLPDSFIKKLSEVPNNIKKEFNLTDQDLMSIQYYNSDTIVFRTPDKVENVSIKSVTNKIISTTETTYRSEIVLPAYTPGVAVKITDYSINVDFGKGIVVPFTKMPAGVFWIRCMKRVSPLHQTIVTINGIDYNANYSRDEYFKDWADIFLLADLTILRKKKEEIQKQIAPGRIINK
jgi:hypothetical protein